MSISMVCWIFSFILANYLFYLGYMQSKKIKQGILVKAPKYRYPTLWVQIILAVAVFVAGVCLQMYLDGNPDYKYQNVFRPLTLAAISVFGIVLGKYKVPVYPESECRSPDDDFPANQSSESIRKGL